MVNKAFIAGWACRILSGLWSLLALPFFLPSLVVYSTGYIALDMLLMAVFAFFPWIVWWMLWLISRRTGRPNAHRKLANP